MQHTAATILVQLSEGSSETKIETRISTPQHGNVPRCREESGEELLGSPVLV